jgi:hypothetical protein
MLQNNVLNKLQIIQMVLLQALQMFIISTAISLPLMQLFMISSLQVEPDNTVLVKKEYLYKILGQKCNIITH